MFPPHEAHQRRLAQRECAHLKTKLTKLEHLVLASFDSGLKVSGLGVRPDDVRHALKERLKRIINEPMPPLDCVEATEARS